MKGGGAQGKMCKFQKRVQRSADDTGILGFRIADLSGFVDVLVRQADVGGAGQANFCLGSLVAALLAYLPPRLGRVGLGAVSPAPHREISATIS